MTATLHRVDTATVRAAVYARQSLDRTGEGLGIARQRQDCEALAAARGWTVAPGHVIAENDVSASSRKPREGYRHLLGMIERREIDVVICWAADRLARKLRDLEDVIELCERTGVRVATVSGDLDLTTDAGRLVARILTSVARGEMERKSARQQRATVQAAEHGKPPGGPVPFGFRDVTEDDEQGHPTRRRVLDEEQADAVREAYAAVLRGASVMSIAREWNRRGLPSGKVRTGRERPGEASDWTGATVRRVLGKARNAGLREHRGEIVGPAGWPAIVSEETWRAALAELDGRQARETRPRNAQHLLSGVAACGRCGGIINAGTSYGGRHSYRCREALGHVGRRGDHADDYVSAVVVERLLRPDAADLLPQHTGAEVADLRERGALLRRRLDQLADDYADGTLDKRQYQRQRERKAAELADLDAQLAVAGRTSVVAPLVAAGDVRGAWDALTTDERRTVIDALMTVVLHPTGRGARYFDPETVEIRWKGAAPDA